MAATLVTLAAVKVHQRLPAAAGPDDTDLQETLDAAEASILSYIGTTETWRTAAALWTDATIPADVKHAILLKFSELWRFRGDDLHDEGPALTPDQDQSPAVTSLLRRWRDPVLA